MDATRRRREHRAHLGRLLWLPARRHGSSRSHGRRCDASVGLGALRPDRSGSGRRDHRLPRPRRRVRRWSDRKQRGALFARARAARSVRRMIAFDVDALDFAKSGGTVTVVARDAVTGDVLMVAAADREAFEATMRTGEMHYRSRTRGLWRKGETSGHVQRVVALTADCDGDAVVALVRQTGA